MIRQLSIQMARTGDSDLANVHYKTGCLGGTRPEKRNQEDVDQILETESSSRTGQPWSRLNQTSRVSKLKAFAGVYAEKNGHGADEKRALVDTLLSGLERRRLGGAREVVYNKETGAVESIPSLVFQQQTKRFTLKRSDRRVSTLKSLGRGKRRRGRRKDKIDSTLKDSGT